MKTKETNPTRPGSPTPGKQALSHCRTDRQDTLTTPLALNDKSICIFFNRKKIVVLGIGAETRTIKLLIFAYLNTFSLFSVAHHSVSVRSLDKLI